MPVTLPALREHFALRRIQCGKQRRGPVASVIVGHAFDVAQSNRQHRLRAFERLNLAFFIHTQKHRTFRRMQVQTYNIPYFPYKKWIGRELEMTASSLRGRSSGRATFRSRRTATACCTINTEQTNWRFGTRAWCDIVRPHESTC